MARKRSVVVDTRIICCGDTNRLRFMRTVGVTVLVCVACGCDEPTPTTPSGEAVTIHGRIVDFAAGSGLSWAIGEVEEDLLIFV